MTTAGHEAPNPIPQTEQLFQATVEALGQFSPEATALLKDFLGSISKSPAKTVSIAIFEDKFGQRALDIRLWTDRSDVREGVNAMDELGGKHSKFAIAADNVDHWFNIWYTDDAAHDITGGKLLDSAAERYGAKPSSFKIIAISPIQG